MWFGHLKLSFCNSLFWKENPVFRSNDFISREIISIKVTDSSNSPVASTALIYKYFMFLFLNQWHIMVCRCLLEMFNIFLKCYFWHPFTLMTSRFGKAVVPSVLLNLFGKCNIILFQDIFACGGNGKKTLSTGQYMALNI